MTRPIARLGHHQYMTSKAEISPSGSRSMQFPGD
jgi:hypothetical protein